MKFGIDDILRSFEISFDVRKLWFQLVGLIVAFAGFGILLGLGALTKSPPVVGILAALGLIFLYVVLIGTAGGICKMIYNDLVEKEKVSAISALNFAKKNFATLIFSPIVLGLLILGVVIVEFIISLLRFIPFLGEILLSVLTLPLVLINIFLIMAVVFGGMLLIAIIAVEETGIVNTVKRIIQAVRKTPIELIVYSAISCLIATVVIWGVLLVYLGGLLITSGIFWPLVQDIITFLQGYSFPLSLQIAAVISGLSLAILTALVISYPIVFSQGIATSIYLAIKERL